MMKSIAPIFTILTLATALPKAQFPRADTTAGNLERLPRCGRACFDDHWRESRCNNVGDYGCLCLSRSFRDAVKPCIVASCYDKRQFDKVEIWIEDTCGIYNGWGLERVVRRAQSDDQGETRRPPRDGGFRIPARPYDDGHYDDGYHGDGHDGYHRDDNREGHRGVRRDDRYDENRDGHRDDGHRDDGHRDDGHRDEDHLTVPRDDRDGHYDKNRDGHRDDGHRDDGHRDEGHLTVPRDDRDGHRDDGHRDDGHRDDGHRDDGHRDDGYRDEGHLTVPRDDRDGHRDDGHRDGRNGQF
ncbi:hypothetical protein QBC46DRAFT_426783 [Diplogelasinospora grovesii]|uniref:CFEM domain-containing protein n=1 Tax=Diplogelasinospora grovesii TaxID=303347 RepID=A0AAN6RYG9_9PEZI|nr:hypothetical protein QBC46DRAFT_426783 [Diplogelasinospora grovesii]